MTVGGDNPYGVPASDPVPAEEIGSLPLATLGERFMAAVIDFFIELLALSPLLLFAYYSDLHGTVAFRPEMKFVLRWVFLPFRFLLFVAIHFSFLRRYGQTIGKRVMKIKIVDASGEKPSMVCLLPGRYGFRYLISMIPFAGWFFAIVNYAFVFRKDRRCIHDLLAGTRVVKVS